MRSSGSGALMFSLCWEAWRRARIRGLHRKARQSPQRDGGAGGEGRWGAGERMPQEWSWGVDYERRSLSMNKFDSKLVFRIFLIGLLLLKFQV